MFQHYFKTSEFMHFEKDQLPHISRYVVSDDPHWASGYHMHDNETELIWVEKGTVQVMVNANKYTAHAGDIIALEKGNFHMLASDDSDPATTYTCAVYGFKFTDRDATDQILQHGALPIAQVTEGAQTIRSIFREFDALLSTKSTILPSVANAFAALLTTLFYENFKLAKQFSKDKKMKNLLIREVLVYLNENYKERITLESLSKRFRASVSYIAHEFASEYGISPINYVIQRRITEAKFALTTTNESLNSIAWAVGYENTYHFSKLFQRHVGCSPTEYRRKFNHMHAAEEESESGEEKMKQIEEKTI